MSLRMGLYRVAEAQRLDAGATARLLALAGLDAEPAGLRRGLPRFAWLLGATLAGLGLIMWVAANWDTFGRAGRFALLQAAVLVPAVAACRRPVARVPLALLSLIAIGGLFAYFGQTYQTGADPWQLFALWALLALPLCLVARSEVLWLPWVLIAMSAIPLWVHAHGRHSWRWDADTLQAQLLGWAAAIMLLGAMRAIPRRLAGIGEGSWRLGVALTIVMITVGAIGSLIADEWSRHYLLALVVLGGAAVVLSQRVAFDLYALSAVAFGLLVVLVAGLARWLFDDGDDPIGALSVIGLFAALLLAAAVSGILRLARLYRPGATA